MDRKRRAVRGLLTVIPALLLFFFWGLTERPLAGTITVNGTGTGSDRFGALPEIIYTLATSDGANAQIYPLGKTPLYLFGIFDTGADAVLLSTSNATLLGFDGLATVDVRINGLSAIGPGPNFFAPIGPPFADAQAHVPNIGTGLNVPAITSIGTSVGSQVEALIDYTKTINTGNPFASPGPDITFYRPGAAGIPTPDVVLSLSGFGFSGINPFNHVTTEAQRYDLQNITFTNGALSASDPSYKFFYDTGTNLTIIDSALKAALGLTGPGSFNCFDGTANGFNISSVRMTGSGGSYILNNATVCVSDKDLVAGQDAIIGSNFFSHVTLLFDGPDRTLGIFAPANATVPEPSTILLILTGISALMFLRWKEARRDS